MKPLELMKLWSDLQIILSNPNLTDEDKLMVGEEVRRSLPPSMTCTHSIYTRELVEKLIKKELENYRGRNETKEKEVTPEIRSGKRQESKPSPVRKSKLVRENAPD